MAIFSNINDAMSQIGSKLQSPAWSSVNEITSVAKRMDFASKIDTYAMQMAFPNDYSKFAETIGKVDLFSAKLIGCGDFAGDALQAATTDYIKNTGIQQAGRELADKIGQADDALDCVAGFAVLFESKLKLDDAMGLSDLPQMSDRIQQVIKDATDPSKLAIVIRNMDIIDDLLQKGQGICDAIHEGFGKLIDKDLNTLISTANKLSQWAAFAKMATSDPCGLVTNNKMLSHITEPVMDDIVSLYESVTSEIPAIAGVIDIPNIGSLGALAAGGAGSLLGGITNPNFNPASGAGQIKFDQYKDKIITVADVTTFSEELEWNGTEWADKADIVEKLEWNGTEWADANKFSNQILKGSNPLNNSTVLFENNKNVVDVSSKTIANAEKIIVESCQGAVGKDKKECYSNDGHWITTGYEPDEFDILEHLGPIGVVIEDVIDDFSDIAKRFQKSIKQTFGSGSGKDVSDNTVKIVAKTRTVDEITSHTTTSTKVTSNVGQGTKNDNTVVSNLSTSTYKKQTAGAKFQSSNNNSNGFDSSLEEARRALTTGDMRNITVCSCTVRKEWNDRAPGWKEAMAVAEAKIDAITAEISSWQLQWKNFSIEDKEEYKFDWGIAPGTRTFAFPERKDMTTKLTKAKVAWRETDEDYTIRNWGDFQESAWDTESKCSAQKGVWKCQKGKNAKLTKQSVKSLGMNTSKRVVSPEGVLPSKSPFDVTKL